MTAARYDAVADFYRVGRSTVYRAIERAGGRVTPRPGPIGSPQT
ncbi:MAG: hypothetical protein ACYDEA_11505 [Candidatus Dormibacteria bacterium]